ncbi:MAG: tetraacyldisaccharide 4'-kinase [Bacteroidales bacterium]|nr:tetraacyldisaccharide 4'-kinase [Bacteroidales bacterium]
MLIYKTILRLRHRAYDRGRRPVAEPGVPTVCVGNVTVGGTGKTPLTELILRMLQGRRLAVLSRGYGRKTRGYLEVDPAGDAALYGDEPLQIARKFPGVRVVVDEDRIEGCNRIGSAVDAIILDDAYQYRKLKASLNIVLVDYNRPVFKDYMLPFGRLRDLPERIFKADVIIVTKCPAAMSDYEKGSYAKDNLRMSGYEPAEHIAYTPAGDKIPVLFATVEYQAPRPVFDGAEASWPRAERAVVISGTARNRPFIDYLSSSYSLAKVFSFPDHHAFTEKDVRKFNEGIWRYPFCCYFTTEKDAQRLIGCAGLSEDVRKRLFTVPIEAKFLSAGESALFAGLLENIAKGGIQADDVL